jgi:3-deoxy-D-manno-octulosonic-acid transferase
MWLYERAIGIAALRNKKAKQWKEGRRNIFAKMAAAIKPNERIVWVHAASLGEFEQGRPIIEQIKREQPEIKILLTFFSPSGYEIRKNYEGADYIFYLPIDRRSCARRFIEIVRPEAAIFIKYEFWLNYLAELRERNIPTYIVSTIFRRNSIFFRPWGGAWRKALGTFSTLFVQNEESKQLLKEIGITNVVVAGDTRFDRVAAIAKAAKKIPLIERFKGESPLFVAGSTWGPDEQILIELINDNPSIRFVIAPHEMDEARIKHLIASIKGGAVRYTDSSEDSDFSQQQVLILDTVGILSSVYGYATWSYIGGGFGVGIHNTLEAATFGLPIAFGPKYQKFKEACDMVALGAAKSITSYDELKQWFEPLRDDKELLTKVSGSAKGYAEANCGATELIVKAVLKR